MSQRSASIQPNDGSLEVRPDVARFRSERYFGAMGVLGAAYGIPMALLWSMAENIDASNFLVGACGAAVSAVATILASAVALLLGGMVINCLQLPMDSVRRITFASGLLGFFTVIPILVLEPRHIDELNWFVAGAYFLLVPGVITPVSQLIGGWSERPAYGALPPRKPWRFGIGHLLVATTCVALLLTLFKLIGWSTLWVSVWTSVWLVYQWCTFRFVIHLLAPGWGESLEGGGGEELGMRR